MNKQSAAVREPNKLDDDAGRRRRGVVIAALTKITKDQRGYRVRSGSSDRVYFVDPDENAPSCTCPDFMTPARPCKHVYAVRLHVQREEPEAPNRQQESLDDLPTEPEKESYSRSWREYDLAQVHEADHFEPLLWELCRLLEQPRHSHGRPRLPIADMAFAVATKAQHGMSRRRSMGDVRRAKEGGYIGHVPADSSITRYLAKPELTPVLKWLIIQSALPLASLEQDFAIDSTGIASTVYERWYDHKWGKVVREVQWVKAHLLCGVTTQVVAAADVSEGDANDSPFLRKLVNDIRHEGYDIQELSADKAYLSKGNFDFADDLGFELYVPFKSNSRRQHPKRKRSRTWERAFDYFHYRNEEFLEHYNKRSISEAVMNMIKAKYGAFVRSRAPVAQYNEVLSKVLCHNIYCLIREAYELGIGDELQRWVSDAVSRKSDDRELALAI